MSNRFLEMNYYLKQDMRRTPRGGNGRYGGNGVFPAVSASQSYAWARPFSATQRVLIILIENGGIDLHIPQLADSILSALPGAGMIPDSVKHDLRDVIARKINDTVKSVTKDLLETVELAANRYTAAKPDIYGDVIILRNGAASFNDLKLQLFAQTNAGKIVDLFILTHGSDRYIAVNGGIDDKMISGLRTEFGKPLSIRSVYMMNCVGSSLNQAWLDAGARTSSGTLRNNYMPEPTMFFFWQNWQSGKSFETSVTSAYEQTIQLLNDAINGFLSSLSIPIPSGLIDAHKFDFVRDSAPVLQGDKALTISSDDISFAKSMSGALATTVVPVGLLRSLSDGAGAAMQTSQNGIDLIKRYESFKSKMYNDPAGHCTIGYGTLLHKGNCDGRDSEQAYTGGLSEADATKLLQNELSSFESLINSTAKNPLNQNQFDALASFVYNVGTGAFNKSTLAKLLRGDDYSGVPAEIRKWTKARVNGQLVDLKGLVKRRNEEADLFARPVGAAAQSLSMGQCGCLGMAMSQDRFDRIVSNVFGAASYDEFLGTLQTVNFLNRTVKDVHPEMVSKLQTAEATLTAKGISKSPPIDSTLRKRHSMHGLGMAIDFDVLENPYVLNEAGEADLDAELIQAYDHIANFVLGNASSSLRNLKSGRKAFGGTIAGVYDALRAESDAMKLYFSFIKDANALAAFLTNNWPSLHQGQTAPDLATAQAQIEDDYEILGGKDQSGNKRKAKKGDRPFAAGSAGGRGDPATGFLNLDRDFVLALTDAGLSWGAIDMGAASGDVMHFDCRLNGLGAKAYAALLSTK
ncbi:MAG TPA: lysozyme [Burkholderiaceae bacterium]